MLGGLRDAITLLAQRFEKLAVLPLQQNVRPDRNRSLIVGDWRAGSGLWLLRLQVIVSTKPSTACFRRLPLGGLTALAHADKLHPALLDREARGQLGLR